jgi:preprotein translocase subunit YajC
MTLALILLQQGGGGGIFMTLMPFLLMFGVFYFLIILPQRRRQRELQTMIAGLKPGDRVVTTGGIIATVTAVRERSLIVRSADKSMLEIARSAVAGMHSEDEKAAT